MVIARKSPRLANKPSRKANQPSQSDAEVASNLSSTSETNPATSGQLSALRAYEQEEAIREAAHETEMADLREELDILRAKRMNLEMDQSVPTHAEIIDIRSDPRFRPLVVDYSYVDPIYFHQIARNEFDPRDISNLENEVSIEEGRGSNDIRDLAHLIRCLGVYWQAKLHFAPQSKRDNLSRAFHLYQDHLLKLYPVYTWDSVRDYHLRFHLTIGYDTDNPDLWRKPADGVLYGHLVQQSAPRRRTRNRKRTHRKKKPQHNSDSINPR